MQRVAGELEKEKKGNIPASEHSGFSLWLPATLSQRNTNLVIEGSEGGTHVHGLSRGFFWVVFFYHGFGGCFEITGVCVGH